MWKFLRENAFQFWPLYLGAFICLLLTNAITTRIPLEIRNIVNALTIHKLSPEMLYRALGLLLVLALLLIVIRTFSRFLSFMPGRLVELQVRNRLYQKLMRLSQSFYQAHPTGDLMSRLINDLQSIRVLCALGFLNTVNTVLIYVFVLGNMIKINPLLTFFTLCPAPFVWLLVRRWVKKMYVYNKQAREKLGVISSFFVEVIGNSLTVKSYYAEPALEARLEAQNEAYLRINSELVRVRTLMFPFIGILGSLGQLILLVYGGHLIISGKLSLGELVAFSAYLLMLAWPTASLAWLVNIVQNGRVALERMETILDEPETIQDTALTQPHLTLSTPPKITLKNLTIEVSGSKILNDVSFELEGGKSLGIFGLVGSGKTTLIQCLTRIRELPENVFFLNGNEVHAYPLEKFYNAVGYASQTPFLFSDTITENIAYVNEAPSLVDDDVKAAAKRAMLEGEIATFPKGYETVIGEKGIVLSGGQKSRLALARAYYKKPLFLVLDDVFAAVDHKTEVNLLQGLFDLNPKPTLVMVSHRVSTLSHCDEILVLEAGRIVDRGPHTELLSRDGAYKRSWEYQQMAGDSHE